MSVPLYCQCVFLFLVSFLANEDLLKSVLECSELIVLRWKVDHPSDTEEDITVGLSSEDEAEGLAASPGIARHSFGGPAATPTEVLAAPEPHPTEDEVVLKKMALKLVKQQVSPRHGEDLPEGAQDREVAKVPYQIPVVPREAMDCPVCQQSFKTHHQLMVYMGVHQGEKYPCTKCGKVLANKKMWKTHIGLCPR